MDSQTELAVTPAPGLVDKNGLDKSDKSDNSEICVDTDNDEQSTHSIDPEYLGNDDSGVYLSSEARHSSNKQRISKSNRRKRRKGHSTGFQPSPGSDRLRFLQNLAQINIPMRKSGIQSFRS